LESLELEKQKRRRLWPWALLIFLLIIASGVAALRIVGKSDTDRQILALRQAGLPTSSAELNQWYRQVPPSNNAALIVEDAIAEYVAPVGILSTTSPPAVGEALSPELKKAIAQHIETNHEVIEKLHAAAQLTESRYPINLNQGMNTLLPHLAHIKGFTQLLRYQAMLQSAGKSTEEAVRSVATSFALARTLRNEPILISELVRIACVAISIESLERVLSEHQLKADQLKAFDRELAQAERDGRESAFRGMVGERAGVLPYFASVAGLQQLQGQTGASPGSPFQVIAFGAFNMLGLRERDLRLYLGLMEQFTAAATNDFPEMLRKSEQTEQVMTQRVSHGLGKLAVMTRMMLPAIGKAFTKEAALATRIRCARVAIAIEEYRLEHSGALPATLGALVPDYMEKPLLDPVLGKPFTLERLKTAGYQISSAEAGKKLQNTRTATFSVYR